MKHTENKNTHTLVFSENEWNGLESIMSVYNEALAGTEFDDEDEQKTAKRLFKLFEMPCLIDDMGSNE